MTLAGLIKELAKREGKKSQVTVGNIRELIKHLRNIIAEEYKATEYSSTIILLAAPAKKKKGKNVAARKTK